MRNVRLFCFPYAGGSATVYNTWKPLLQGHVELIPVELAGRGRRIKEPLFGNLADTANDIIDRIESDLDKGPFALLGHSMGAAIALELSHKIRERKGMLPAHVFLSGRRPPHIKKDTDKMFHLMSEETFRKEVLELGGTPREFFEHPELLEIFLPMLRSDFKNNEIYEPAAGQAPIDSNCTVWWGVEDDMEAPEVKEWERYFSGDCTVYDFNGGHFFIHDYKEDLGRIINQKLMEELTR